VHGSHRRGRGPRDLVDGDAVNARAFTRRPTIIAIALSTVVLTTSAAISVQRDPGKCQLLEQKANALDDYCQLARFSLHDLERELRDAKAFGHPRDFSHVFTEELLGPSNRNKLATCAVGVIDYSRFDECVRAADTRCLADLAHTIEESIPRKVR
jgi:hypothetical protein